ncbi:T9SS C-terminal target domain-containing protein [Paenimyroides tangerinum]|uniref:T9SS C-terminal target domain-containing protein n=1 Tax=Paenimyroides tangerinum TaxID=2488728 RepID=A0A3P3WBL6_9FLAO|nr:T9SS type A sorting domain-containing protein [Paenimyroides tangerinum]RRJ92440.1 T9SS C-terminal target domain-containing protein [Paenimyroides tangerinum]
MRKIYLLFLMLIVPWLHYGQINVSYTWNSGLEGWTTSGPAEMEATTIGCNGSAGAVRTNLYSDWWDVLYSPNNFRSPLLANSTADMVTVSLSYRVVDYEYEAPSNAASAGSFNLKLQWSSSPTGPWTDFGTPITTPALLCTPYTATFTPGVGDVYVRMVSVLLDEFEDIQVYFDELSITQGPPPSCQVPTNGVLTDVSSSSVAFSWSAPSVVPSNGYQYEVRTDTNPGVTGPALVGQGTTAAGVLNASVATLAPSTAYNVYVRSNCGTNSFSQWVKILNFNTLCTAQDVPYLMPIDATTGSALPQCVTIENLNNDTKFWETTSAQSGITDRVMKYSYNSTQAANDWFFTKGLNLTAGHAYRLKFKFKTSSTSAVEKLKVMLGTGNVSTSMQTELFNVTTTSANASSTVEYTILDFVPAATGVYYVGFQCYSAADQYTLYVGEVSVDLSPTCLVPGNLQITNVTRYGSKIQWQAPVVQPQNGYEYEIRTSGEPGSGAVGLAQTGILPNTDLFKNVTGLLPLTQYFVYVRSVCVGTDVSVWTPVKTFKTLCDYSELTSVTPGTRCGTGTVDLSAASNSGQIKWFSTQTSSLPIYTGSAFTTPIIEGTTSYWVSNYSSTQLLGSGGISANTSTSASSLNNYGLVFNLSQNVLLKSTKVYRTSTAASGTISVKILNSSGDEVYNTGLITLTQTGGTNPIEVPLNVNLPSGNGYRILLNSYSSAELVRLSSGVSYPYVDTNGILNVTSGATGLTSVSATSYYYFFDLQYDATCASPRTEVVATVTAPPVLELSETEFEICEGESVLVTVTEGVSNYDSYDWSINDEEVEDGIIGNHTTGWTFSPTVSGVYTLTAHNLTSDCTSVIDVTFNVNSLPDYTPLDENATICIDVPLELNPNISGKDEFIVGTATTLTGNFDSTTAFNNRFSGSRQQYIFTKTELNALGFDAGNITGISFEIATLGSANSNSNYTIKMRQVSQENFSTTSFLTGTFTTVFGPVSYTHQPSGWHDFEFTTPFVWDGSSNILIELTHGGANSTNNAQTYYTETTDDKSLAAISVTAATGTLSKKRLNTKFLVNGLGETVWTPATNLYLDEGATQPYVGGNAKKVYFKSSTVGEYNYSVVLTPPNQCVVNLTTAISVIDVTEPIVADQSICSTEVSNITVTGLQTGGTVKWYETETSTEELDEIPATGTYFVEQVVGTCKSARVSAVITLNLQLPAPVALLDQKFCLDTVNTSYTVADLDATATTGTIGWFTNVEDTTPLELTTELITGTYYAAEFNGTCWSPRTEVEVAIGTMPAVPNGASQAFCSSLTLADVEVGQVPGATVNWYASADATETLDTENPLTDATYYVSQIIGFCESERIPIQIQLIPVFDAPVAPSPVLYCQETTFDDLEVTLLPGGTKGWFTSIATAEPNIQLTDIVTSGTYYVAQYNGACWSNKTPVVVTVNPTPAALNNVAQTLCGTFTLADAQLGQVANATVKFYTSVTSDIVLPMTTPLVTGTYYVSQTLGGCESDRVAVQFTVHEKLTAPVAPATQFYCGTKTFADLDATLTTGTIGWFAIDDTTTAPLSLTANVSTGTYYVAQLNGTCWSPTSEVEVTINPIPATLNDADQQLCGTFTLADAELDQVDGAEVRFFASEASTTPMALTSPLVTGTYYVSQMILGCESVRVPVSFVVNEILTAPQAPAVQFYCGPTTFADLSATPTTGTIGWFATDDTTTTPLSATTTVSTGVYYVAQLNGQCWSPTTQVTVSVNPIPASLNNASQQLCGIFTLADAELGQAENAVVFFYATATSSNILPSTNSLLTGTYYVSQMVLGCESPRVAVSFVVNENLSAPQAPAVQSYCGTTTFADLSATPTTGTIGWFTSADATTPMASTASVVTGTYFVAQLNGQCWSPRTTVNVTVNPVPTAPSNATIQLCGNYNFGQVSIGQVSGATIKWYATETSTTPINPGTNVVSGSYYVSQTIGGCESERVMVTIFQTDALSNPTAVSQTFCGSATVADLVAQGTNGTIVWYNSSVALNPLSSNTALATGTYYVAQTLNGCFSNRVPISVFVVSITAPNVDAFNLCGSATVADLVLPTPTGVVYKWFDSPSNPTQLDANVALVSGTYFVSRTQYGCESLRTPVAVNINSVPDAPTGVSPQVFIEGSTINDIVMDQPNVVWYMTQQNAQNGINPLVQGMPLVNGTTYYGVIIGTNGCPSLPFALTVDVYLSDDKFVKDELKYYPNPVEDLLTISYSDRILLIEVFDLLGKRVKVKSTDDKEVNIDLSDLASGTYMIQLKTENKSQFLKIIKK